MKYFKLFEDWDDESINEGVSKFANKLVNLSDGKLAVNAGYRFKNLDDWTPEEMETFLKQHYIKVKSLPIGKPASAGLSGSSKYPGWSITDTETKETKTVLLAVAQSAQEKFEDPLVQELNDYFEDADDSKLSSQSKAIINQIKKKTKDIFVFIADSKDSKTNNFASNWKQITAKLGMAATGDPRFKQDSYNPADILVWNLTTGEENSILNKGNIGSLNTEFRKYVKHGKIWPISLKAGGTNWEAFNIYKPAAKKYGDIKTISITPTSIQINQKLPYGLRISNQGTSNVSWEVRIKGSGGQGGKVSKAYWADLMLKDFGIKPSLDTITIEDIDILAKTLDISVEDRTKTKGISHNQILTSCYDLLLSYQKNRDVYSLVLNLGTKAISPALVSNKKPLDQGSPFYKLG